MKRIMAPVLIIGGVVVATIQLTQLLPMNPSYEAGWGKFAFASLLVIVGFAFMNAKFEEEHGS